MKKRFFSILLIFILIITNCNYGILMVNADTLEPIVQGREIIRDYYVETVPDSVLNAGSLTEIVKGLNDPYSHYFTASEYDDFVNSINNSFCGIGITMAIVPQGAKVLEVVARSPALAAGILPGDIITNVDGHELKGLSNDEIVSYIRGAADTSVDVKLTRGQLLLEYNIIRKQLVLPTVTGKVLNNNVGYINLASFGEKTGAEFGAVLDSMPKVDSYIVDLRNDGGGYISTAQDIAGYFIGNNPLVKLTPKSGVTQVTFAAAHKVISDKPIVFLVNENSASASEILSAAVKDYDKAFFVGTKTYGKGVAQSMFQLTDGSVLKLTTFKFVSPKGNEINKVGITPDLILDDKVTNPIDPLQTAEVLLSGDSSNSDKTGVTRLNLGSKNFEITSQMLQNPTYKQTADYIMNNVATKDNKYVWSNGQWVKEATASIGVSYDAHVQNKGWQSIWGKVAANGLDAGTTGQSLRLEGIKIKLTGNLPEGAGIEYKAHIQNQGWDKNWYSDGALDGTTGLSRRIEAMQIKLVGLPGYSVKYRVHVQGKGWDKNWSADGEIAGTTGLGKRIEAIEIKVGD
jgi:carboxyl-terminal processing protease